MTPDQAAIVVPLALEYHRGKLSVRMGKIGERAAGLAGRVSLSRRSRERLYVCAVILLFYGMIGIPLTYFLERLFARKGAHASLPRGPLLENVGLGVLVLSALSSGATALAADKTSIELACGGSKATITCQKLEDGACVASQLTFDTIDGKHVISTYQPPQHFVAPTIADSLQCDLRPPMGTYFAIEYTPGCPGAEAQCITIKLFDLSGKKLTSKEEKTVYGYPSHATPKKPVSLRGHN